MSTIAEPLDLETRFLIVDEDGLTILRSLDRATAPGIIIVSVIGEEVDRIVGLEMGADDYVAKPANPRELLAQVRSVLRRRGEGGPGESRLGESRSGERHGAHTAASATAPATRPLQQFAGWRLDAQAR